MPASGLPGELAVTIRDRPAYYSLYADGPLSRKLHSPEEKATLLFYPPGAALILYYTYPALRTASLVRNLPGKALMPGLSRPVRLLFSVRSSKVDKLRRAAGFLNANAGGAFGFPDAFYTRLCFIVSARGGLNYPALVSLAARAANKNNFPPKEALS